MRGSDSWFRKLRRGAPDKSIRDPGARRKGNPPCKVESAEYPSNGGRARRGLDRVAGVAAAAERVDQIHKFETLTGKVNILEECD